jgi:hypothetical protein
MKVVTTLLLLTCSFWSLAQTAITIYPDTLESLVPLTYKPGVFYVPKTEEALNDFYENDIHQNSIRTHVVESVLNNTENLEDCLALLETVEADLVTLSDRCQKLVFIYEKMPAWLSSSDDSSPAATPGWAVLHTRRPADWTEWKSVVTAITDKLVNDFGIDNAWIEVWNEPDLGSWTSSQADFMELYKTTYDGVKAVDNEIPVGGPAVNFWSNNIFWHAPVGKISDAVADSSLISELLDYGLANDRLLDFVSWHNFNLSYQEFQLATGYMQRKCDALGVPLMPLLISEWNAPSMVRETPLHKAFMVKGLIEIGQSGADNQMIAAWQDFEEEPGEFHADYGMLTWGAIHKPAYYASLMMDEMEGALCKTGASEPYVMSVSAFEDSLYLVMTNYCPPPLVEALNHTLYEGGYTLQQLDSAGFIDILAEDVSYLEDIYQGEIIIGDDSPMHTAINASISVYAFYEARLTIPHTFEITLEGYSDDYFGQLYLVDDEVNNNHFRFDSLMSAGMSRAEAVNYLQENQGLRGQEMNFNSGSYSITLEPNAIALIKVGVNGVGGQQPLSGNHFFQLYPNPANNYVMIETDEVNAPIFIYDMQGHLVKELTINSNSFAIDLNDFQKGIYLIGNSEIGVQRLLIE